MVSNHKVTGEAICGEYPDHDEEISDEDEGTIDYYCMRCDAEWSEDKR